MKNHYTLILALAFSMLFCTAIAQKKQNFDKVLQSNSKIESYSINDKRETPSLIKIKPEENLTLESIPIFLNEILNTGGFKIQIAQINSMNLTNNSKVVTFQTYHQGIKVEHGKYNVFVRNQKVVSIVLEHYLLNNTLNTSPSFSEEQDLEYAKQHVGAERYVWEDLDNLQTNTVNLEEIQQLQNLYAEFYPTGELVIVDNYQTVEVDLSLAYKFNIYASSPLYRAFVYVDANTGEILLADMILKHTKELNEKIEKEKANLVVENPIILVQGSGDTRYAGNRSFSTTFDAANNQYVLDGTVEVMIDGSPMDIAYETRSYDGGGGTPISVPGLPSYPIADGDNPIDQAQIEVGDNNWTATEHWRDRFDGLGYPTENETNNDDVALDAHWGTEVVIKYWAEVHNRPSFDGLGGKITSYVHYGDAYDNAFFNGSSMTYGDGSWQGGTNPDSGRFAPLSSMDVCAHEIGHGVCNTTSALVYANESGGMNEGFSDIWGASIENWVLLNIDASLPYDPWGIGEQIEESDGGIEPGTPDSRALRWMDDPKAEESPDCYGGDFWTNQEGCQPTIANDQCGVHTTSGVLNKWFYLIVTGSGQALSPGGMKDAFDDEINDDGNAYSVSPIGFDAAEQIAFKSEVLLTPNATYAEMRDVSIMVAEQLHGTFSYEVEQVTNAWFAVCVGNQYIGPDPDQVFFEATNASSIEEATVNNGCNEFNTLDIDVTGVNIVNPQNITLDLSSSTATVGEDFDISTTSLTFNTAETQTITLTIYNDGIVEGNEEIVIEFSNAGVVRKQTVVILDDDYVPSVGSGTVELLNETFDTTETPVNWEVRDFVNTTEDVNSWGFNGASTVGQAYVYNRSAQASGASYDGTAFSNIYLLTGLIDSRGITNVNVSFDWQAGGETDQVDETILFDYGEFLYSFDGTNFTPLETFAGSASGANVESGTYDETLNVLDNGQFYLVWRWFNDELVQTAFSMTIDNVLVTGTPALVESDLNNSDSETVKANDQMYFISDEDAGVMGIIENSSTDLGCVTFNVEEVGNSSGLSNIDGTRSGKVFKIEADGPNADTATYDVTFYYTDSELSGFNDPGALQIIKVNSNNIDDASDGLSNYTISGGLLETNAAQEYRSYKGSFTGFSTFALYEPETLSNTEFDTSEFSIYPTVVSPNSIINISNANNIVETISVYGIKGNLIKTQKSNTNHVTVSTKEMTSGLYFLVINKTHTFKFIVK